MASNNTNSHANCYLRLIHCEPVEDAFFCVFLVYEPLIILDHYVDYPEVRIMAEMCSSADQHKWTNGVLSSKDTKKSVDTRNPDEFKLRESKTKDGFVCKEVKVAEYKDMIWKESKSGCVTSPLTKSDGDTAIIKQWSVDVPKDDLINFLSK